MSPLYFLAARMMLSMPVPLCFGRLFSMQRAGIQQVDAVVQQTHVQTQIERLLLLPRQIGIAVVIDLRTQLAFGNGNRILSNGLMVNSPDIKSI